MPWEEQIVAIWWGLGIGAAIVVAVWAVIAGGWSRRTGAKPTTGGNPSPEPVAPIHEYPEGLAEAHGPIPLIVTLIIVGFVIWAVGYVVLFVQRGYTFS